MRGAVCLLLALTLLPSAAGAATFTVDDESLASDAAPGDGACVTASGTCTGLAAFEEAQAHPGADAIVLSPGVAAILPPGERTVTEDLDFRGAGASQGTDPSCATRSTCARARS